MLPASARLRSPEDFRKTTRKGIRCGRPTLVIHAIAVDAADDGENNRHSATRVGFVVSKAVGNAVKRNSVKRRLRHLVRQQMIEDPLPGNCDVVIRALPAASVAAHMQLSEDLQSAWRQICRKVAA